MLIQEQVLETAQKKGKLLTKDLVELGFRPSHVLVAFCSARDCLEIGAEVTQRLFFNPFGLLFQALVMGKSVKAPAIQTDFRVCAAFRTTVTAAHRRLKSPRVLALVAGDLALAHSDLPS